jgi:DNA-binding NarL/FixJ family response regulator
MSTAAVVDRWPLVGRWDALEACEAAIADCDGIVLFGAAGVGKTRLADELGARLETGDRTRLRAVASKTAAATPLGALAHVLPPGPDAYARAAETFAATRPVLAVDDLHLLDATSLTLLAQLVANGLVFLIGTVRTGEPAPDGVDALVRSDRVVRIDLDALTRDDVDTLLHLALGGPLDGATAASLWNASQGNVLFLRELVLGARAADTLTDVDGVWTVTGPLASTGRLNELLAARIGAVDPDGVSLLELLACCGAVGLDDAETTVRLDTLAALEQAGLIALTVDERRRSLALAHPLYGDILRAAMGTLRARALLTDQVARVAARGARRREDPLLIASWQLEAGAPADPALVLRGARLARGAHDFAQVERLARAALRVDETSAEAAQLAGEACYELGRFDDAEAVLGPADDVCERNGDGSTVACDLAIVRAQNLTWGLSRLSDGLAVRGRARARGTSEDDRGVLLAGEASELMFIGPNETLALLASEPPAAESRASVARAIAEAPALAFVGRTTDALVIAHAGFEAHGALGDVVAMAHPGTHVIAQVVALAEAGSLAEAGALAQFVYDVGVADNVALPRMWGSLNLGRVALLMGRPVSARRWLMECAALARPFRPIRRLALSGLAIALSMTGDAAAAQEAATELAPTPGEETFVAPELWLGAGWAALANHEPERARDLFEQGADEAAGRGYRTCETWLLHEIARVGAPERVAARLLAAAEHCDGVLVAARAAHADALVRHDADALAAVAEEFATSGADLVAAEAAGAASDAYRRDGDSRRATALQERSAALLALCEGAETPSLVTAETVVPLTRREREIAVLAAEGLASKAIGERLFLSARTVDNHLQRVYTKLGVTRRADLADALKRRGEQ